MSAVISGFVRFSLAGMRLKRRTGQRDNVELTLESRIILTCDAGVAELADGLDSKIQKIPS